MGEAALSMNYPSLDSSGFRGILSSALRAELTPGFSAENSPQNSSPSETSIFHLIYQTRFLEKAVSPRLRHKTGSEVRRRAEGEA